MLSPDSRANLARCQAEAPLIALCRFPKPALSVGFESFGDSLIKKLTTEIAAPRYPRYAKKW
jgi:hypothetical protein